MILTPNLLMTLLVITPLTCLILRSKSLLYMLNVLLYDWLFNTCRHLVHTTFLSNKRPGDRYQPHINNSTNYIVVILVIIYHHLPTPFINIPTMSHNGRYTFLSHGIQIFILLLKTKDLLLDYSYYQKHCLHPQAKIKCSGVLHKPLSPKLLSIVLMLGVGEQDSSWIGLGDQSSRIN